MDKDKFIARTSDPNHPIHAAMVYMESLEKRNPPKATGWIRTFGLIVALVATVAIIAIRYSF